jgi:hypothetical protein
MHSLNAFSNFEVPTLLEYFHVNAARVSSNQEINARGIDSQSYDA